MSTSSFFAPKSNSKSKSKSIETISLSDSDDMEVDTKPKPSSKSTPSKKPTPVKRKAALSSAESDEEVKPSKKTTKKKVAIVESSDEEEKGKGKGKAKVSKPPSKKPKVEEEDEPTQKKKEVPKWIAKKSAGPSAPGSKDIPDAKENCLAGLTFVFTGELESLSREAGQDLVKRYGGRVTTAPSSKTSYVILGSEAGPKKLEMIAKHKIKTLSEDAFLELLGNRPSGENDPKYVEMKKKEDEKVREQAKEMGKSVDKGKGKVDNGSQLWTVKYAPTKLSEICGNKGAVEKLSRWLEAWPKSLKSDFKKPGPDAMGGFRCILISGPPGIGKTTAAHLVAKLLGYSILELNASDVRSKKLLEVAFKSTVTNTTLGGFFKTGDETSATPSINQKSVIIMDEVDGMSSGDRGGVGALNALIKKTLVPIIAICNDKAAVKMKPLTNTCFQMPFKRPSAQEIRSRMMSVAFREGVKLEGKVMDQLVAGSNSDIRQIVNMLSTWKLGAKTMSYDEGKSMAKMNEKNQIQTPWSLYNKLTAPQAFSAVSDMTLNDKLELYFTDHSLLPLFVQDNYLKSKFTRSAQLSGMDKKLKDLELMVKASESISDGDLVDGMIHGGGQWSLMPVHGIFSCVRPAYYCYGQGSMNNFGFPTWFGKNSTQGKLGRLLGEIQIRMRLRVSGDRKEIRQSYIPTLFEKLVKPLREKGADGVEEVIQLMDEYFLTKEDWDAIVELGVGADHENDAVLKTIAPAVKTSFTRTYNKREHPVPFYRDGGGRPKKMAAGAGGDLPDTEDVQVEDEEEEDDDEESGDDAADLSKDKLIRSKKPGKAGGGAAKKGKK